MEHEQLTIRLTPMPREQVSIAIVRTTWRPGRKPHLELVDDVWVEPGQVAGHIEPWVAHVSQRAYEGPACDPLRDSTVLPLRPPR